MFKRLLVPLDGSAQAAVSMTATSARLVRLATANPPKELDNYGYQAILMRTACPAAGA